MHAIWSCPAIASVWSLNFGWLQVKTNSCLSFLDVIQGCQDHCGRLDLLAMILAQVWSRRNKLRVGEASAPLTKLVGLASDSLQEFQRGLSVPQPTVRSIPSGSWTPPPPGWLKINFDGAMFKDRKLAGLGGVIRNDYGLIMAAFTQTIPLPTSIEMVEVLAARSALVLAKELCLNQVLLEGDSEIIINALSNGGRDSSSYGHILLDIKLLTPAFMGVSFCHSRRQANKVAHRLARSACNFPPHQVWMEELPLEAVSVYFDDLP